MEVPRESQNYIVEAILLNDSRHQQVAVSRINLKAEREPVVTSEVVLERGDGTTVQFSPNEAGVYHPPSFLTVATGDRYRLHIANDDESVITSEWETVPVGVALNSGSWKQETTRFINDNGVEISRIGFNFEVNTGVFDDDDVFLRYDYQTTHINDAPFRDPRCDCINCYVTLYPKNFLKIASARNARGKSLRNELVDHLLLDKRFSFRLTMLVKQLSITKNVYAFYQAVDQQRNLSGSIFDPPPAIIAGNLSLEGAGDAKVYGVFEVGTYSETTITIYKSNIDNQFLTYQDLCYAGVREGNIPAVCFSCYNEDGAGPRPYYFED